MISGIKPDKHDLKTINEIIEELNSCLPILNVKLVNHFPSLVIIFDTLSMDHGKGAITGTQQNYGQNKFFPLLSNTKIFINTKYTNQNKRDSFLWRAKTNSLFSSPRKEMDYYNSVIIGSSNKLGYTFEAIFTTFIFNENPFLNFTFFQYEIYFSSFSILTGVILLYVDGILFSELYFG